MNPSTASALNEVRTGEGVTLSNWRTAPFNEYAFQHVRELVPSVNIENDPERISPLRYSPIDLDHLELGDYLKETQADGFLIINRGRVVCEQYLNGMTPDTRHILMSVSKSILGLLAGILDRRGIINEEDLVTRYLPELTHTGYAGATIRQLLDMRVGIAFNEDYLATSGLMIAYRKATNWNPLGQGEQPSNLLEFFRTMREVDGQHGGRVNYVSPNTDVLGLVIERATGERYSTVVSELLWKPMGAEWPAYITVDSAGGPRSAGGVCVTLRDLGRVGELVANGGECRGKVVLPEEWIEDIERGGDRDAWRAGSLTAYFPEGVRYRSKWYVLDGDPLLLFAFGIHGQYLFVDRKRQIVIAQLSCQAEPLQAAQISRTLGRIRGLATSIGE